MRADLLGCEDFQVPFVFVDKLQDAVLPASSPGSVTLHCVATFSKQRPPIYHWRRGVTDLPESSSSLTIRYTNATDINSNYQCSRTSSSVRDVQCYATYQCSASLVNLPQIKDDTYANVTATLKIPGKPIVHSANIQARSAEVTWTYNRGSDEAPIDSFTLQHQNNNISFLGSQSSKQLNNLKPYTSYTVRVKATSFLGTGDWSDPETFTTLTDKPSIAPQNITSQKINETTYNISWDPLSREQSNGPVKAYEVEWIRDSSSRNARATRSAHVVLQNTTETYVVLHGLTSCSKYSVQVRAYTSAGPGVFSSPPLAIKTTVPGPPSDVSTENAEKRTVTLRWKKPILHGDYVQKYTVIYEGKKDYFPDFLDARKTETASLTLTVDELYPGTKYNFVIFAATHCGSGDNGTVVSSETLRAAPVAPVFHEPPVLSVTEPSVNVTVWSAPQDNGPISYYQVVVHLVKEWTDSVCDWKNLGTDLYVAAQIPSGEVKTRLNFLLGDGKEYGGFVNKELSGGQKYNIYSRGLSMKSKKRSAEDQFLIGVARLIAKVEVKEDEQGNTGTSKEPSCPSPGCNMILLVVPNIVSAILLCLSFGWNVYLWRARRTSKPGEKYSPNELKTETTQKERAIANVQPPQEPSNYMELQPTRTSHVTDQQYMNTMSQYQHLTRRKGKDSNPSVEYKNASFLARLEKKDDGAGLYEEVTA